MKTRSSAAALVRHVFLIACLFLCVDSSEAAEILSPSEAAQQIGKTATVEFRVRGVGFNKGIDSDELCSETRWDHPEALLVRLIGKVRNELPQRNVLSLGETFFHQKVRVTGEVKLAAIGEKKVLVIDLEDLGKLEIADGPTWPDKPPTPLDLATFKKRKIDLRPQFVRWNIQPRSQGQRGACQVFALTGVAEFHLARQGRKADLSEMFIMWAANDVSQLEMVAGFNPDLLIAGWDRYGISAEDLQPYVARDEPIKKPSEKAVRDAAARTAMDLLVIKHWSSGVGCRDDHLQRLLEELQSQSPVTVTLAWPTGVADAELLDQNGLFIERDESTWNTSGHGTVFVGYELNKKFDGGGAFIFRNSWGPEWGENGYGKITLTLARKLIVDAYAVQPIKPQARQSVQPKAKPTGKS